MSSVLAPSIADNLAAIDARIMAACNQAGRRRDSVTLVAVSKTHMVESVEAAFAAGQLVFGENRVAEADSKFSALRADHPGIRLHLIGPIQSNKVADAVRVADVIETLDRPRLADVIARAADQAGRLPRLLVQVNIGDEGQKSGVATAEAADFIAACRRRFGGALEGLMCIPPAGADPAPYFAALARMAADHGLATLSMGMSGDFEVAIRHGATHVRVGSAIFGHRPPAILPGPLLTA